MTFSGPFVDAVNAIIDFMFSVLNAVSFEVAPGIGFVTLIFSFIVLSIVISVFWKGGRG